MGDPILDAFIGNPTIFTIGLILALGLLAYKKILLLLNCLHSKVVKPLGHWPVQNSSVQVHNFKENSMTEVTGIKDTKEVVIFANDLAFLAIESFKGPESIQIKAVKFISGLLADSKMMAEIMAASDGIQNIPAELKDISVAEGIELVSVELTELAEHLVK